MDVDFQELFEAEEGFDAAGALELELETLETPKAPQAKAAGASANPGRGPGPPSGFKRMKLHSSEQRFLADLIF